MVWYTDVDGAAADLEKKFPPNIWLQKILVHQVLKQQSLDFDSSQISAHKGN